MNHKSSFYMGDEINGYGQEIVLAADQITPPRVSQENVRLTPNFNKHLPKIIYSSPAVNNPDNMAPGMSKMIGSLTGVNQVAFSESSKNSSEQASALEFQLASSHAASGGGLARAYGNKTNSNDGVKSGWYEEDGNWVYYKKGKKQKKEFIDDGGKRYYVDSKGYMVTGWKKVWWKTYYFKQDGSMVQNNFRKIEEIWYYFDEEGRKVEDEFIEYKGDVYYLNADGHMVTGEQTIKKKTYYFDENGRMLKGHHRINDGQIYFDENGVKADMYIIHDFLFLGMKDDDEYKNNEDLANELMNLHQQYHGYVNKTRLATQGSILACTFGTKIICLDTSATADICDKGTGLPILGCNACKVGEHIYSFNGCWAPDIPGLPMREIQRDNYRKCIPLLDDKWIQTGKAPIIWNSMTGKCSEALKESSVIACRYKGIIGILEIPEEVVSSGQPVQINKWLIGYTVPSQATVGRDAYAANLPNIFKDWYTYEKMSGLGTYVLKEYPNLLASPGSYGELLDDKNYYWIAVGPRIINKQYSDDGDLTINKNHDVNHILVFGKYADVVLQHISSGDIVYVYCRIGDVKAHTWIFKGDNQNGLSQTGDPYPNNASNEPPDPNSANGATIEFMGHPIYITSTTYDNGDMSKYRLLKVIVYD